MAIKELFRKSKTINYPFEKGKISPRMRGATIRRYPNGEEDVYCINYEAVRPAATQLSQQKDRMVEKTTRYDIDMLKCIIVDYVKSLVRLMQLYKDQTLNCNRN